MDRSKLFGLGFVCAAVGAAAYDILITRRANKHAYEAGIVDAAYTYGVHSDLSDDLWNMGCTLHNISGCEHERCVDERVSRKVTHQDIIDYVRANVRATSADAFDGRGGFVDDIAELCKRLASDPQVLSVVMGIARQAFAYYVSKPSEGRPSTDQIRSYMDMIEKLLKMERDPVDAT